MKPFLTTCISFLFLFSANAQAPSIDWQKCLGGTNNDIANSIIQTTDGGYAVAGYTISNNGDVSGNNGYSDYWIVKLSSTGVKQWASTYGGTGDDVAYSIIQTTDGGYAVAGYTTSTDSDVIGFHGDYDYWIVKLSSTGVKQWASTYGGASGDYANSIIQTTDGGYAVAGWTASNDTDVSGNHGYDDYWIVKLSSTGVKQWASTYGGASVDIANSIIQTTDGGYAVAGYTISNNGDVSGNHGGSDYWIVKLSSTGVKQWASTYGGSNDDIAFSIIQTTDGGYAVAGWSASNDSDVWGNNGYQDYWIVKLSSTGVKQWAYTCGGTNDDVAYSIIETTDGGYAVAGYTRSNDGDVIGFHGGYDYWIVKLSSTGVKQWAYTYGGASGDIANSIIQTTDGGYAVAGYTSSNNGDVSGNRGGGDYWIVKLSSTTGIEETVHNMGISLYPNPASESVTVSVDESMIGSALSITDITGREVMAVRVLSSAFSIPTSAFASGVYFITLENKTGRVTKKLVKQ